MPEENKKVLVYRMMVWLPEFKDKINLTTADEEGETS